MGGAVERLEHLIGILFGRRDPMRHRQEEAIKIARETGGDPPKVAEAYGVPLPEIPTEESEEVNGS